MSTEALKRVICLALALPLSAGQPPGSLDPVAVSPDRFTALLRVK